MSTGNRTKGEVFRGLFTPYFQGLLKEKREKLGFSLRQLATALRVSWSVLRNWEEGKVIQCLPRHREKLARFFAGELDEELRNRKKGYGLSRTEEYFPVATLVEYMGRVERFYGEFRGEPSLMEKMRECLKELMQSSALRLWKLTQKDPPPPEKGGKDGGKEMGEEGGGKAESLQVDLPEDWGKRMQEHRKALGVSAKCVAKLLQVSGMTIRKWESGQVQRCHPSYRERVAAFLEHRYDYALCALVPSRHPLNRRLRQSPPPLQVWFAKVWVLYGIALGLPGEGERFLEAFRQALAQIQECREMAQKTGHGK